MDRSDDNENSRNNQSLGDDTSSRRLDEEDSVGQKRKRDNLSASLHSQHGGEATMTQNTATHQSDREEGREQQTTSQQRVTEQSKQLNELLVENRELRRKLSERDREIEALRGALEREKQRWLKRDDESQSNDDTAIATDGTSSTSAASGNSVVAENRTTSNESTEFDESTDEEMVQLSSTSSMDRRHHNRRFNDVDDADAEEGGERKISSVETNVVVTQSQLHENDYNDEGRKEAGGENEEEHTTLPDSGNACWRQLKHSNALMMF